MVSKLFPKNKCKKLCFEILSEGKLDILLKLNIYEGKGNIMRLYYFPLYICWITSLVE